MFQGRTVPHVVTVTGDVDAGMTALLSNSLQPLSRDQHRLQRRKVLFFSCLSPHSRLMKLLWSIMCPPLDMSKLSHLLWWTFSSPS